MTYYEHRRQSDRAYFATLIEGRSMKHAIELSGLDRSTVYRKMLELGLPVRHTTGNRGNGAWQSLADSPR